MRSYGNLSFLGFVPNLDDIPTTEQNFVKDECLATLRYGESYDDKKNIKVYQTEQVPGFVLLYYTNETETIHRYKNDKLQAGIFRAILSNGDSSYGTEIFDKSLNNGEEDKMYK